MGVGAYPLKPAGILVDMGTSFSLDPQSLCVWLRHFVVVGVNARSACLQKPALTCVTIMYLV